jgi:hypothetical protein
MTPERRKELDRYYAASLGGGTPTGGVKPPTDQEEADYRAGRNTGESLNMRTSDRVSNPRGTANPTGPGASSGTSTSGGGSSRGRSSTPSTTSSAPAPRESSAWSQFLRQAMEESGPEGLRIPFEQHPSGVFDRYQAVAQPGFGRPVPNMMPGQGPRMETGTTPVVPGMRSGPPPGVFPPRYQNLSPTLAPGSPTMGNLSNVMQRMQPMMNQMPQRPMQSSFPPRSMPAPMPSSDTRFVASNVPSRSYSPPPSYRQPRSAEDLMAEMGMTR